VNAVTTMDPEESAGLGIRLREGREARGLTPQQAAELLNLDVTVVEALEREDFAALGAPVFARGHLRRYGLLLGLAEAGLIDAYEALCGRSGVPTLIPRARQEMQSTRARPKWPWVTGGALLFLLVAAAAAYLAGYGLEEATTTVEGTGEAADIDTAPAAMPVQPTEGGAATDPEQGTVLAPQTGPSTVQPVLPLPPGHVSLSLTFAADSWVEIYDGSGKAVLYDLGRAGSQRTIAAAAPLSVTFGNGSAVTVAVNGRPATVAVPAGQTVARFRVETDGSLR